MEVRRAKKGWLAPITRKDAVCLVGSEEGLGRLLASANGQKKVADLATGAQLVRVFRGRTERFAVYATDPLGDVAVRTTLGAIGAGKRGIVITSMP